FYSLFTSMGEVIRYLKGVDYKSYKEAIKAYSCFDHFNRSTETYSFANYFNIMPSCEKEVISVLSNLVRKHGEYLSKHSDEETEELFQAEINAMVVCNAEEYYRCMMDGGAEGWNKRDTHMMNILQILIKKYERALKGKEAKVVVWAHNSHIGDASQTDQGWARGEINIGQLARERLGHNRVFNIGFTTHSGTVIAASNWGASREVKTVNLSRKDSVENIFHSIAGEINEQNFILPFTRISPENNKKTPISSDLVADLAREPCLLQRAIGVIYAPHTERASHYYQAKISKQFDAVIHIDWTNALKPLDEVEKIEPEEIMHELPETFPTGE
ncbi:16782_t:CDS:2, partial [Acaulospora morrowiae]